MKDEKKHETKEREREGGRERERERVCVREREREREREERKEEEVITILLLLMLRQETMALIIGKKVGISFFLPPKKFCVQFRSVSEFSDGQRSFVSFPWLVPPFKNIFLFFKERKKRKKETRRELHAGACLQLLRTSICERK